MIPKMRKFSENGMRCHYPEIKLENTFYFILLQNVFLLSSLFVIKFVTLNNVTNITYTNIM